MSGYTRIERDLYDLTGAWVGRVSLDGTEVIGGGGGGGSSGIVTTYPTAITATGNVAATHFGGSLVPVNSASAVQLNVPLDSALALPALSAGSFHLAAFDVAGVGAVTFAGATGVTINGVAGPTPVTLSFAQFQQALLKQTAANTWTVS